MLINIFRAHFGPPKSTAAFASCLRWTRFISSYPTLDLIQNKPRRESNKIAIRDEFGAITYKDLFTKAYEISTAMKEVSGRPLIGERVTFFANNNRSSAQTLLAAWINGSVAVPLCTSHPISEKEYFIKDSDATLLVGDFENAEELKVLSESTGVKYLLLSDIVSTNQSTLSEKSINQITEDDSALIVYTSGTTGRPKGVLHTHSTLSNTITDMITSWYWTSSDHCLHSLPLHHVHGLINALLVPLSVNASVYMLPTFKPKQFWDVLLDNDIGITITTAVPTIYAKLLQYHRENNEKTDEQVRHAAKDIRLMISGSSGLPVPVFNDWIELTGHVLIERYGMTETCMTLTNKITSNGVLVTGTIGVPFPSVQTCIAREDDSLPNGYEDVSKQTDPETGMSLDGELYVKGGSVFKEYWRKPEATKRAFTSDGWFKTGDTMCIDGGYYKILGRTSVDIIKSGGFKISALDIENKLLTHPDIIECCVLGKPDNVYGQTVAAVIVSEADLTKDSLSSWCSDKMPKYHIPTTVVKLNSIPRNAMGKINKKSLTKELFSEAS